VPATGSHGTIDIWSDATKPNVSASLNYAARLHAAGDPKGDPPALRRLVIQLPPGSRVDTSVPPRCSASDDEIRLVGESACPLSARIGSGEATVKTIGGGTSTYETVIYNAEDDMLELIKSGDRVISVVHTYVRGETLVGPVPTCLTGGNPPEGCPSDQVTLIANSLHVDRMNVGPRRYGVTPRRCPKSRRWSTPVRLEFGDGSVETLVPHSPCKPPKRRTAAGRGR
jgi:hypothetical protein